VDHQAEEEEDNRYQVMLSAEGFHRLAQQRESAKPSKSLAANGDGPLGITVEGKETDFLEGLKLHQLR